MATPDTLTVPQTPNIAALNRSLAGLEAMEPARARNTIAALDSAWMASNGSVVATARATGQPYRTTLDALARPPVKNISEEDPRFAAYDIAKSAILNGEPAPKRAQPDDASRATQERNAMARLSKNPDDDKAMNTLITIAHHEASRDISLSMAAKKTRAREADAR